MNFNSYVGNNIKEYTEKKFWEYINTRIRTNTLFQDWFETGIWRR